MLPVATDIALSKLNVNLNGVAVSARRFIDIDGPPCMTYVDGKCYRSPKWTTLIRYYISSAVKKFHALAELLRSTNLLKKARRHVGDWGDTQLWRQRR